MSRARDLSKVVTDSTVLPAIGHVSTQVFSTPGSFTWTKPAGIKRIKVFVTAGGGGGGSHNSDDAQGGGGGGGTSIKLIDVTSVSSVLLTVGAGGNGSAGNTSGGGTSGGSSSFGSYCSATGGAPPVTWAVGGAGGTATGGDLNIAGGDGTGGNIDGGGNEETGGSGGSTFWGGGPAGGSYWGGRLNARVWGVGGAGTHASTNDSGSAGMSGVVIVEEYR